SIWIAIVFSLVSLIVHKQELMLPMYSLVGGMGAADFIYIGKKENKKGVFGGGIAMAVLVVFLIVLSILGMCGVIALF
ncbi:MAG: hypothetical protein K2K04_03660, partial [Clostridia bacterium]|nr:hypothetical protein [Clostridia bacterium]